MITTIIVICSALFSNWKAATEKTLLAVINDILGISKIFEFENLLKNSIVLAITREMEEWMIKFETTSR